MYIMTWWWGTSPGASPSQTMSSSKRRWSSASRWARSSSPRPRDRSSSSAPTNRVLADAARSPPWKTMRAVRRVDAVDRAGQRVRRLHVAGAGAERGLDPGRRQDRALAVGADQRGEAVARPRRDLAADDDRVEALRVADAGPGELVGEPIEVGGGRDLDVDLDPRRQDPEQLAPHRQRDGVGRRRVLDRDPRQRRARVLGDQMVAGQGAVRGQPDRVGGEQGQRSRRRSRGPRRRPGGRARARQLPRSPASSPARAGARGPAVRRSPCRSCDRS